MRKAQAGERALWYAERTRTKAICSASRGTTKPVSEVMRQIVDEAYHQWLIMPDDWTPQRRETFLRDLTRRLDRQAAQLADELAATAITQWTARHGQHPDYLTTVGLRNTAISSAREIVIKQEIYDQIPEPTDDEDVIEFDAIPAPPKPASQVPWNQRWNDARYRSEPGEDLENLAARVWPDPAFSVMFRIKAAYLLIARTQDGLPVPTGPQDPLAAQLAPMIYDDLRADGYPVQ